MPETSLTEGCDGCRLVADRDERKRPVQKLSRSSGGHPAANSYFCNDYISLAKIIRAAELVEEVGRKRRRSSIRNGRDNRLLVLSGRPILSCFAAFSVDAVGSRWEETISRRAFELRGDWVIMTLLPSMLRYFFFFFFLFYFLQGRRETDLFPRCGLLALPPGWN